MAISRKAEEVFLYFIGVHVSFCEGSIFRLEQLLNEYLGGSEDEVVMRRQRLSVEERLGYQREIFREVHNLLSNMGIISKILWPPRGRTAEETRRADARGGHLRNLLGIGLEHALRNRTLRNHLEHLDERIDSWSASSESFNVRLGHIGPIPADPARQRQADGAFGWFDPRSMSYLFMGEVFDLYSLVDAMRDVDARLSAYYEEQRENI